SGQVSKKGLEKLSKNPKVKGIFLVKNKKISLLDSIPLINADDVHSISVSGTYINGSGQTICIIDTGIDYTHADLGGCGATSDINDGSCDKVIGGYDFIYNDSNPADDHGHGTHVAGTAAGQNGRLGVAPDAKLVAIKACNNGGFCPDDDVLAGIDWCINNASNLNISVITLSLGSTSLYSDYCDAQTTETSLMDTATGLGIFVDASSGNDDSFTGISAPACIKNVTSVGSTIDSGGSVDTVSSFSNSASILDVLAPGEVISSAKPGGGYQSMQGTSMAAPHVAGAAALIYQYEKLLNNKNATPSGVREILKKTGKPITDTRNSIVFPRIDVLAAINSVYALNESDDSITDRQSKAKIKFRTSTDLDRASEAFEISDNYINMNASRYPEFDKPADLIMYNLEFNKTPIILKDGIVCTSPECNVTGYDRNLSFSVSGFSNYTAGANSQLEIFDDVDNGIIRRTYQEVYFFANYTNRTSEEPIDIGYCNITFTDINGSMAYNPGTGLFNYTRTFSTADLYYYNVTCYDSEYETLNTTDDITILPACTNNTGDEVSQPLPNNDWIIEDDNVTCTDANLYFQNQTLILKSNSILTLNNCSLILNQTTIDQNIIINETAYLNTNRTNISSIVALKFFNIHIYGKSNLFSLRLNGSILYLYGSFDSNITNITSYSDMHFAGSSVNSINNLHSYGYTYFEATSNNTIINSVFDSRAYFDSSSYSVVENGEFNNYLFFRGNSIVDFIIPLSNATFQVRGYDNPTIKGYIDMPDTGQVSTGLATRHYPVHINYTNGTAINNTQVNITNSSGHVLWSGYTDENGLVNPNLVFASTNYTDTFNISVNPSQDIELLTDTPIQFLVVPTDTSGPIITLISPANNSIDTDGDLVLYYNVTDQTGIENCSLMFNSALTQTDTTVVMASTQTFPVSSLASGFYNWSILCYDNTTDNHMAQSGLMNFEVAICGDDEINGNEYCDGTDINAICEDFGYDTGYVSCTDNCLFDVSDCDYNDVPSSSGGGGGPVPYCTSNWTCTDWSDCIHGIRRRTCTDLEKCSSDYDEEEEEECGEQEPEEPDDGPAVVAQPVHNSEPSKDIAGKAIEGITPCYNCTDLPECCVFGFCCAFQLHCCFGHRLCCNILLF
ncbi:S8 family serine peptidase, partial [Thermoproteota archaeon]